jgi:hypothetical protein
MITIEELFTGCTRPPKGCIVIEPFVGDGAIMKWIGTENIIIPYDSEPKVPKVLRRNTLLEKPKYYGTHVITKAPQLKKSDSEDKTIFEQYGTDDLYKCFIKSLISETPSGGIIVLPLKFLSGLRDSEVKRRADFFKIFKPNRFNVFNMDTVVVDFTKRSYTEPFTKEFWNFNFYPENESCTIEVDKNPRSINIKSPSIKQVSCTFNGEASISGYTKTNLVLLHNDTDKLPMGLYASDNGDKFLHIKGVLSKKLHMKLGNDFNDFIIKERAKKENIVVPFTYIDNMAAADIIEELICSYYKEVKIA